MKHFHPLVWQWFLDHIGEPTEAQSIAWPKVKADKNVLISAPTGSGKTLSAFFAVIDDLVQKGLKGELEDRTYVVYVSPLKALSNDIEKNLRHPLSGIKSTLKENGLDPVNINVGLRTGDTTASQRTAMFKKYPHILVSTPESLYILLTSINGRKMLSSVSTIIVDEIHAIVESKRGSHLALTMERLAHLSTNKITRIGLSATQKPIEKVGHFLSGTTSDDQPKCEIVNVGHKRALDMRIEVPRSPLSPLMANEVWEEVYDRLEQLIEEHRTTLIFVHTRRLAERMSHNLANRLGKEFVAAHHGSMAREHRFLAESKLKEGRLKVLVATASLELGIDIGGIDLVCQMGSTRSISSFMQRIGRSGHHVGGVPKGILFPLSLDELIECTALIKAVSKGELDELIIPEKPLDILAQQIVSELAGQEWSEEDMFTMIKGAFPFKDLTRKEYDDVLLMLSDGYTTRRGRRGAYIHHDMINGMLRARKNARLTALTSGGAIPDNFDYDVVMEPSGAVVGSVNEDFAIESLPGDIFQLGNQSWRLLKLEGSKVRVEDAQGAPPTIPFWFGETPGRSKELSQAVCDLRDEISVKIGDINGLEIDDGELNDEWKSEALTYLENDVGLGHAAADQIVSYLAAGKAALDELPNRDTLIIERFFDQAGDMHLVVHSPFGSRLNRAWGLSLRKRFCKKFNFELQAAATEDNIILSLGSTHSFPLEEVFQYLNPKTVRDVLVQALLDAPMFEVRWRWNASRALAILRMQGGKKMPPQIQRSLSEDLIALVFPDQLACLENIEGEREVPQHPLIDQTIKDCLTEAMDIDELEALLTRIKKGEVRLITKDLKEPSPLSQEVINARPYAFLDPGEAAERRTNNIQSRSWIDLNEARKLSQLDFAANQTVKLEAWPQVRSADELHDALVLSGCLTEEEGKMGDGLENWVSYFDELQAAKRALRVRVSSGAIWIAAERVPEFSVLYTTNKELQGFSIPERISHREWTATDALVEIVRGRLEISGPVQSKDIADALGLPVAQIDQALLALENDGFVFQGLFNPGASNTEWCERRLLARIHRYSIQKLRSEVEPLPASDYMRFLFDWHGLYGENKLSGPQSLESALEKLEGYEAAAAAWEGSIIPDRLTDYEHIWLDVLCISGRYTWGKFRPSKISAEETKQHPSPIKSTPICLLRRLAIRLWKSNSHHPKLTRQASTLKELLVEKGASFFGDLIQEGMMEEEVEHAVSELVSYGLLTSDSFSGMRALLVPTKYKSGRNKRSKNVFSMEEAGRWSLIQHQKEEDKVDQDDLEEMCMTLLRRYGVVFRKLADKEHLAPSWRELVRMYRILEARGTIRGGRFVQGVWGEQYALPEAVSLLKKIRKRNLGDELVVIGASDPLNLTGIITPGGKIPAYYANRILYKNGEPIVVKEGNEVRWLTECSGEEKWKLQQMVIERNIPPKLRQYLGKGIV